MLKLVVDFHLLCSYTKIHKSGFRYSVITGVFQTRALPFFLQGSTFSEDYLRCWQQAFSILTDEPEISLMFHLSSLPSWQAFAP